MTAATTRQSPSQSQSASPPQPNNSQSSIQVQETSTLDDNQAQNYCETNFEQHQIIGNFNYSIWTIIFLNLLFLKIAYFFTISIEIIVFKSCFSLKNLKLLIFQ
jgi:hypothetical protein